MLIDPHLPHSHSLINPEQTQPNRQETYTVVSYQHTQFRLLNRQYQAQVSIAYFWCVFWMAAACTSASLFIVFWNEFNTLTVWSVLLASSFSLAGFVYRYKKRLQGIFVVTFINLSGCSVILFVMLVLELKYSIVPTGLFIAVQIAFSVLKVKHKGKIAIQLLLLGQFALLALKRDEIIDISWAQACYPLIPIAIFITAAILFISIYSIMIICHSNQSLDLKKHSLIFLVISLLCFASLLIMPLGWVFFDWKPIATSIIAMALTSTNSTFLFLHTKQIALFFCVHKEQIMEGQKQIKVELVPTDSTNRKTVLHRFSDNWFGYDAKPELSRQKKQVKLSECLICMQRSADVVWMPCGHLALCTSCCRDMLGGSMISCVLCKQKPTEILRIKRKDSPQLNIDRDMGLSDAPETSNGYQIQEHYTIRLSS